MFRPSRSWSVLALLAAVVACDGNNKNTTPDAPDAEGPAAQMQGEQGIPEDVQKRLVPGKPAVTEPIDLVREIEKLLDAVTDRASAMDKRIAIDGRLLALRKKLPDWEHVHGAARELLKVHGDEGRVLADRVREKALALAENAEVKAILMPYLQQVKDMLE